jgi:putative ubiquitin-RnfH superfamily antitoxin RatB of RatAB toxin-antitoxin module
MAPDEVLLRVEVVYAAAPHDVRSATLTLQTGATVADALRESHLLEGVDAHALQASIWNRTAALDASLRDGDRVELTRGLLVDPKEARRLRYQRDGVRSRPLVKTRGSPTR